jgi:subtilisin-like proprotein convertase family protein
MPAPVYNFQIEQGSAFEITFQYNNENGEPIDLSSGCVILQWQETSKTRIFNSESADQTNEGFSLTKNNLGQINFKLFSSTTKDYDFSNVIYDLDILQEVDGRTENTRILTGTIGLITRNFDVRSCDVSSGSTEQEIPVPSSSESVVVPTSTPSSSSLPEFEDLCLPSECTNIDVFSTVYNGSGITIEDYQTSSGTIDIQNTGTVENIEVAINGLRHNSPQDLLFILTPPDNIGDGSGILLSANSKIPSYVSGTAFSFMFSNRADPASYLHNINNGGLCNIFDKTDLIRFENQELLSSFDHVLDSSASGIWRLNIQDSDVGVSGSIDSWKIILTFPSPDPEEE